MGYIPSAAREPYRDPNLHSVRLALRREIGVTSNSAMPGSLPPKPQPAAPAVAVDERIGNPLCGVGGWLLLFCVGTAILSPLALLADAAQNPTDPLTVIFDVALAGFSAVVGIALWRVIPHSLGLVRAYFIVLLGVGLLSLAVGLLSNLGSFALQGRSLASPESVETLFGAIRPAIFAVVWWSYFKKSQRVRLTFGRNL